MQRPSIIHKNTEQRNIHNKTQTNKHNTKHERTHTYVHTDTTKNNTTHQQKHTHPQILNTNKRTNIASTTTKTANGKWKHGNILNNT